MIYHICQKSRWEEGKARGAYEADSLEAEGFMHASTITQVVTVANAVFTGQSDLVFLVIDEAKLVNELKYETASNGEAYPHLYGTLNPDAVVKEMDYVAGADGVFVLPDFSEPFHLPGIGTDEIERVKQPLEAAWTLPPAAYSDPAIYEFEEDRIFRKSWIPVGRLDQVPHRGDYMAFTLLDQPLVLVHGHDGEVRVMSRVCLHRAAPLVEGEGNRKLFICPYHAWSYATDGKLVRAPLMEDAAGFEEKKCRLPQVRTEIWNGFILVNLDDEAEPLAPQIETYTKFFANYKAEDVVIVETLEFDSHWNWKVLVENFMEAYHHIATHATTFEPTYHAKDSLVLDNDGPYSILHMPTIQDHDGAFPIFEDLEDWQQRDLLATVIFPFFMLAFNGDLVIWYQVIPLTHDHFTLKIHLCAHKSARNLPDFTERCAAMREGVAFIHGEDIAANDLVWQGLNAPMTRQGRLSPLEKSIWQMNQWWLGQM